MENVASVVVMVLELAAVLGLLLLADGWLHRHLQGVLFLIMNDAEVALWLYALILFPGVALHEVSHALIATLLGVKIGRISIFPRRVGKRIQLGFVPVQSTDFLRASLIGGAPLVIGGAVVAILGSLVFGTPEVVAALAAGEWLQALAGLRAALRAPDAWLWAYLVFAVSNTMLPSRSDTHAWPLVGLLLAVLGGFILLIGGRDALLGGLAALLTNSLRWIVLLGASTLLVDLPFFALIFLLEKGLAWLRGVRIDYG
jgi:hypothetical protein